MSDPKPTQDVGALMSTLQSSAIHECWEQSYRTEGGERFYELAFDWLCGDAGLKPQGLCLDVGCGIGQHSLRLARRGHRVEAVDLARNRVDAARDNIERQGASAQITVSQGNVVEGLPFGSEHFDAVLCWGVLMHIPDVVSAVQELVRVTRVGGKIVIYENTTFSLDTLAVYWRTVLRPPAGRVATRTAHGREYWTETKQGKLFIRHASPLGLKSLFRANGCRLVHRRPGEFTEAFTRIASPALRKAIHSWNRAWFSYVRSPWPACGNIYVFERTK